MTSETMTKLNEIMQREKLIGLGGQFDLTSNCLHEWHKGFAIDLEQRVGAEMWSKGEAGM